MRTQTRAIQEEIDAQIKTIIKDPKSGEKLDPPLKGFWSSHVGADTSNLIIVYVFNDYRLTIVGIGTHKIYQDLRKIAKQLLKGL
jgi:mRNA-degrading endonuclease YafQ of YafQ-DinJ toxin-antitoxin module